MKTTEYSRLPNSKLGDSPTTQRWGYRAVVAAAYRCFARIANADIHTFRIANAEERER